MNRDDIKKEWAAFIEYPDGSAGLYVTTTSALIFAGVIAEMAAAHERKVCAWIADTYGGPKEPMMVGTYEAGAYNAAEAIAADIRARGEA